MNEIYTALIAKAKEFVSYTQSTRLTVEQDIQQHHLLEDEGFRAIPHKMVFEFRSCVSIKHSLVFNAITPIEMMHVVQFYENDSRATFCRRSTIFFIHYRRFSHAIYSATPSATVFKRFVVAGSAEFG